MSIDQTKRVQPSLAENAAHEVTPRMGAADLQYAGKLSLSRPTPPAKVPGYEQEEFVGRGAFGEVWKATDSNSGRVVAIKFYSQRGGLDWSHMAREVEKLQYLFSDRYVVQLLEVGWDADPPYYVMEYMPYGSLEDRLRNEPVPVGEAVRITRDIARGLMHAHNRGILHCDLKPSNVMLDQDGTPRLADFGQARLEHERSPALGTLFYMAPEQADLSAMPDARWDVYALGIILYRMVSGQLPYLTDAIATSISSTGPIEERLRNYTTLLHSSPRPRAHRGVPGVDKLLVQIIDRCLALDPHRRYPNAQSVLHALDQRETKRAQRPLLALGLLGPALVVLVMALVGGYLFQETLKTAQSELLGRTVESDQFAAKSVARRFALEVDKRWHILEQEASHRRLQQWLAADQGTSDATASGQAFGQWIVDRHAFWNRQFTPQTTASYWFILDRHGRLRANSPPDSSLVGTYFGYRDYFHGQGHELPADGAVPAPIREPYRSSVFLSRPANRPAVAFSVPILRELTESEQPEVLGVFVMEAELGHFAEFFGTRAQFATLIDLRPDQTGRRGLIVEHPYLKSQMAQHLPLGQYYVAADVLTELDLLRKNRLPAAGDVGSATGNATSSNNPADADPLTFTSYHDSVGGAYEGPWLAAAEPVFVVRGADTVYDSGWAVLVQERYADTLRPLVRVESMVTYGGLVALTLVVVVIGSLWAIVAIAMWAPRRWRNWSLWKGCRPTTGYSGSGSLGSRSASETPSIRRNEHG